MYFDQEYPTETQKKRRAYAPIRKLLKEKNLRFHTAPPAKLRDFYDGGPVTYHSAVEATKDLKKRGLLPDDGGDDLPAATALMERLDKLSWKRVVAKRQT